MTAPKKKRWGITPTGNASARIERAVGKMVEDGYSPSESAALVTLVLEALDARDQAAAAKAAQQ